MSPKSKASDPAHGKHATIDPRAFWAVLDWQREKLRKFLTLDFGLGIKMSVARGPRDMIELARRHSRSGECFFSLHWSRYAPIRRQNGPTSTISVLPAPRSRFLWSLGRTALAWQRPRGGFIACDVAIRTNGTD